MLVDADACRTEVGESVSVVTPPTPDDHRVFACVGPDPDRGSVLTPTGTPPLSLSSFDLLRITEMAHDRKFFH